MGKQEDTLPSYVRSKKRRKLHTAIIKAAKRWAEDWKYGLVTQADSPKDVMPADRNLEKAVDRLIQFEKRKR